MGFGKSENGRKAAEGTLEDWELETFGISDLGDLGTLDLEKWQEGSKAGRQQGEPCILISRSSSAPTWKPQ